MMSDLQKFQHYIAGAFEDSDEYFESLNPATGKAWALMPAASAGMLTTPFAQLMRHYATLPGRGLRLPHAGGFCTG